MSINERACCFCYRVEESDPPKPIYSASGAPVMYDSETGEFVETEYLCRLCKERYDDGLITVQCPVCSMNTKERDLCQIDIAVVGSDIMCYRCVNKFTFTCFECEETLHTDHRAFFCNTRQICDECTEYYRNCDNCSMWIHLDDACTSNDATYCESCYRECRDDINSYDYTPYPFLFHGSPWNIEDPKTIYFGCELEIEVEGDLYDKANEIKSNMGSDRVYIKSDGSLNHGFEIVSHPHTFDAICKLWQDKWDDRMRRGVKSHDTSTCGFHVHVSRIALTPLHIQKIVVFVNAAANMRLISHIAQRNSDRWAKITDKKIGHCGKSYDRYEAVNVTNDYTIEFRIFKGNVKVERILKNLQFVHATIEFTRANSYRDLSASAFKKFVTNNANQYKQLHEYIKDFQLRD